MSVSGFVAIEAQLASAAQRHLQVRFGQTRPSRGDGWVRFEMKPLANDEELAEEVERLCCALVRDIADGATALRLRGETKDSNFASIASKSRSFGEFLLARDGVSVVAQGVDADSLKKLTANPTVHKMLEMLYTDVVGDVKQGVHGVCDFPDSMCPTGARFDVVMGKRVCVRAFSRTALTASTAAAGDSTLFGDGDGEHSGAAAVLAAELDRSLNISFSTVKLDVAEVAQVWIHTGTLAQLLSPYVTGSIEAELPAVWRAKAFTITESLEVLRMVHEALVRYWERRRTGGGGGSADRARSDAISLLSIVSGDIRDYIRMQLQLHSATLWRAPWRMPLPELRGALALCKAWNQSVSRLIKSDWAGWEGGGFRDESFDTFLLRLSDVVRCREELESAATLQETAPATLQPEQLFADASILDTQQTSSSAWKRCVARYEKEMSFLEPNLRNRVKQLLRGAPSDAQCRVVRQHRSLLRRPQIQDAVSAELQALTGYLLQRLDGVEKQFENNMTRASTELQKLRAVRGSQTECSLTAELAYHMFGTGPHSSRVVERAQALVESAEKKATEVRAQWCAGLETRSAKALEIPDAFVVNVVGEERRLVARLHPVPAQLAKDYRNMIAYHSTGGEEGYSATLASSSTAATSKSPAGFKLTETARNAILACEQLVAAAKKAQQSVSNYNTVLSQMLPCTRPMLARAKQHAISQIIFADTDQRTIAVPNHQELEGLNLSFQNAIEALSSDNRHIRRFHGEFVSQVVALQNVDLTRHMDQWRSAVDGMRSSFEEFLFQHRFEGHDEWRRHWDCQIYKALEFQYRRGLESLHENMEEFKVELVFKQGTIQFKPTFEAMREAYYIKLREFVSVPLRFRGLQPKRSAGGTYEIYPLMPVENNARIITVHTKAVELFVKLNRVRRAFRSHLVIGQCGLNGAPDLDSIVAARTGESQQQFAEGLNLAKDRLRKMNLIEDTMKVDCFSISTIPVKAAMEEQLHRLEDSLLNAMRQVMQRALSEVDDFVFNASNLIERQPTTMDEVGEANRAYQECSQQLSIYDAKLQAVEDMNKELRQHAGASIEMTSTRSRWEHLRDAMSSHTKVMEASVSKMRVSLDSIIQRFLKDVQRFATNWARQKGALLEAFRSKKTDQVDTLLGALKDQLKDLDDLKDQGKELESKCDYFNLPKPTFVALSKTVTDVEATSAMWTMYDDFMAQLNKLRAEDWLTFRAHTYQLDDLCKEWRSKLEPMASPEAKSKGKGSVSESVIAGYLLDLIRSWTDITPLLKFCRGEGWMKEHWSELFRLLGIDKSMTSVELTFGNILDRHQALLEKQAEVKQLHARAQGEIQIREALEDLRAWALEVSFTLLTPAEGGNTSKVKLITDWKDIMTQVSDHQALVSSLKDSPFYVHFADEANGWEMKLVALSESLVLLNSIQRRWAYLEPIFARGALPQEQARFRRVDKEFVAILREVEADPRVMSLADQGQVDLNDRLKTILEQMERCQKSLMEYLDAKRDRFPRFFFISDEDLLEILGHSDNPATIQTHLKKLFMGIHTVEFAEGDAAIVSMVSADQERVPLRAAVPVKDRSVEDWLIELDGCMRETLKELLLQAVAEKDLAAAESIVRYPSQILQVAHQVLYSRSVENAIRTGGLAEVLVQQKKLLDQFTTRASRETDAVVSLKLKALILDVIHNIEVVELLMAERVTQVSAWWWQKQLRYQLSEVECTVHMIDTISTYTYEYQGNVPKLVHTPLTDKCYLVLTKGMGLGYGGNPYGPAGTGKTESVKALGSAMGRQVLVFNCDEGIDFKAMGRIFIGIVKCGAWGCFDEFNRLKIDQLSAISQMIQVIQEALRSKQPSCSLLQKDIEVNPHAGIFVTLNPAGKGYGGRTKLPDNLKQLFREVAMSVPDNELITSTMLLSEGFTFAKSIARSVVELYKLCKQLLSHQQHYDWGLRPLKAVLRLGGSLVQQWKKAHAGQSTTEAIENELILQSLNINTVSKLTFDDARLFQGLINDIFPGVEAREITYAELEAALETATKDLGLQPIPSQKSKVLQLYESMNQRMGVVLVGPSGSGKSTILRLLKRALEVMKTEVPLHTCNPKALPRQQLLGYMDPDTREWYDGVLTAAARDVVKAPGTSRPWIICDGDIDPEWIESLNSVLDDNKLLTMPNGVRIQFGSNVNFVFETHSLEYASPATVSRMGVLFFSEKDIQLDAVVTSRMAAQPKDVQERIAPLVRKYCLAAIDAALALESLSVPTTRMGLLNACLNHVVASVNESDFVLAMIRALCSAVTPPAALTLAKKLFTLTGQKPLSDVRPLDTYWNVKEKRLAEFTPDLSAEVRPEDFTHGTIPVIHTVELRRLAATLAPLVQDRGCKPFFLVGPEGCGKGSILRECFAAYRGIRTTTINCSAQTSAAHVVQKLDQLCSVYSTNAGRVFRPKDGERLVIVLKNVNLPKPDKYGTVELHSFIQQLILYQGFYNADLEWVRVENVQLAASMNPNPSAGRYPVAPRLLAIVNIITVAYPSRQSMQQIYTTYWQGLLRANPAMGQGRDFNNGAELSTLMLEVYDRIRRRFEGEEYAHCIFCPRHITSWIGNALLYKIDAQTTLPAVLAYEAQRVFVDCLPKPEDRAQADKVFAEQMATVGYSTPSRDERFATMFVTWLADGSSSRKASTDGADGAAAAAAAAAGGGGGGAPGGSSSQLPLVAAMAAGSGGGGRRRQALQLQQATYDDVRKEMESGLLRFSREFKDLGMPLIPEVVAWVTRVDRVLARRGGHVIVVGRPGVGRRDTVVFAAYQQRRTTVTLNMSVGYGLRQFRSDLRGFIQRAAVQDERLVLVLEDHQIVEESFLELINGLVSSGEVSALFTTEEMELMLSPLREEAAAEGFLSGAADFFIRRLRENLRVALVLDSGHRLFNVRLQANPGLLSRCEVLWLGAWGADTTKTICKVKLQGHIATLAKDPENKGFHLHREMYAIHDSVTSLGGATTPKDFEVFMNTYDSIMRSRSESSEESLTRLEVGLEKLREAEGSVAVIQQDVAAKKAEVQRMQQEADAALNEIQKNMQRSQEQRDQATELQAQLKEEYQDIKEKRHASEEELGGIKPMMEAARDAVSSIRSEQLNEIRSLKAPPEPIRDVLEGVLALLGVTDVSWQSMRKFLGERGVTQQILDFDVKNVTPAIRASVGKLLTQKANSFRPEVIHRASIAAAPMAEWVKAMIEYATIMERIAPLTRQLEQLEKNQREGEQKLESLQKKLSKIDQLVEGLRADFAGKCKEAERLRAALTKAEKELQHAEDLLEKLSGEKTRWAEEAAAIRAANRSIPRRAVVAAAFMSYLASAPEEVRQDRLKRWSSRVGLPEPLSVTAFMRSESALLQYKAEGLPGDELSLENAIVLLDTVQTALVIDSANQAVEWMKTHLKEKGVVVEVTSMHDPRFAHTLELAIRFGKTLLVTEVSGVEPILYPVLRQDLVSAGAKRVVQVGGKTVDWQDSFQLFLFSRSTDVALSPDAAALVTEVNFSVTCLGLESQLLGVTIQHEQPELESQKVELLKKEEGLKVELSKLEERLLQELANSQGNLIENAHLVTSLNEVKTQSQNIKAALQQSGALQKELDEKREVYRPFAHRGALLYFVIKDLEKLNRMYQFGLNDFIALFTATLRRQRTASGASSPVKGAGAGAGHDGEDAAAVANKIPKLIASFAKSSFHRTSVALFKADRLVFGLHFLRALRPKTLPPALFRVLLGAVADVRPLEDSAVPSWAPAAACKVKLSALLSTTEGAALAEKWGLQENTSMWTTWMSMSDPISALREKNFPLMDQLLLVHIFRPDHLTTLTLLAITEYLKIDSLTPPGASLKSVIERSGVRNGSGGGGGGNGVCPVLLVTSGGMDPSMEVQDVAAQVVGRQRFVQIALGGGQTEESMRQLRRSAAQGDWLFLKNLHLVLGWAEELETELCSMAAPHPDFRLIITTEPHEQFPSVLLRLSSKVTVEAPPGARQNMLRTYSGWDAGFLSSLPDRNAQLLFGLAWLHAVVQERRNFVPQGWVKFYEFSPADLKAATDVLCDTAAHTSEAVDWTTLKGVLRTCIYGGRLDNVYDARVLATLIDSFFSDATLLAGSAPLATTPGGVKVQVPTTKKQEEVVQAISAALPAVDDPSLFFLPPNADRAVEEAAAVNLTESLRLLAAPSEGAGGDGAAKAEDGAPEWRTQLPAVVALWQECLRTSGVDVRHAAPAPAGGNPSPLEVFFRGEVNLLHGVAQALDGYYRSVQAVADGTELPSPEFRAELVELVGGRMPARWQDRMEGPREAKLWLALLFSRYAAMSAGMQRGLSSGGVDLADFLRPQTFLNALRQQTARQTKAPLVDLVLVAGVRGSAAVAQLPLPVTVSGATLLLEGAAMGPDGRLQPVAGNAPSAVPLGGELTVGWVPAERAAAVTKKCAAVPVFSNASREAVLLSLYVAIGHAEEATDLTLNGVACYLTFKL